MCINEIMILFNNLRIIHVTPPYRHAVPSLRFPGVKTRITPHRHRICLRRAESPPSQAMPGRHLGSGLNLM